MSADSLPRLIALSPGDLTEEGVGPFLRQLDHALAGGLPALLLREPGWEAGPLLELARNVGAHLRPHGASLLLHDAPHLVAAAQAAGVHLGFRSLPPERVRPMLPAGCWLGLSTHASDAPQVADVDYVFFSPIYATPSKAGWLEPVGTQALAERVQASAVPVFALGGVNSDNLGEVWQAGPQGVVLRSALWGSRHPDRVVQSCLSACLSTQASRGASDRSRNPMDESR
ncbi:MAG: thiamine phosphate synthase [Planctomycetes bacterium]|nr:thiamine phosphate synthase [Planctomycetota bacterium]HPF14178.1 thiamine phosphate synthase [Planctomycetota bacterium]